MLYQLICKRCKGHKISSHLIHRLAAKLHAPSAVLLDLDGATAQLKQSYQDYKQVKKDGSTLRQTWMEGLALALSAQGDTNAATHLGNLYRREKQRRIFRQIKYANGKLQSGSVTAVVAPFGPDDTWIEVSTKAEIERACLEENERRFR